MPLLSSLSSMLKREGNAPAAARPDGTPASIQQARTRARQRLIGALLLLTAGVIGFPLLFESRPRPIPVDIPIDIPPRDGTAQLAIPDTAGPSNGGGVAPRRAPPEVITETPADAGRDVTPTEPAASAVAARPALPPHPAAEKALAKPGAPVSPANADAARAQAALDGGVVAKAPVTSLASAPAPASALAPASTASSTAAARPAEQRYIIQVGAFADPAAARETRLRVERLGLKTYTQVADTPAGPRTRVRVGPFAARTDADKAMARVKAAGVAAAILTI